MPKVAYESLAARGTVLAICKRGYYRAASTVGQLNGRIGELGPTPAMCQSKYSRAAGVGASLCDEYATEGKPPPSPRVAGRLRLRSPKDGAGRELASVRLSNL